MKQLGIVVLAIAQTLLVSCQPQEQPTINYLTSADTSRQLMKEEEFWRIIDESQPADDNYQAQTEALRRILSRMKPEDIEKFQNTFYALLAGSYNNNLWGASYIINGGCSDDCFEYFREYLIAHGRDKFYQTLQDPESCVSWIKSEEEVNWEGLRYSASDAYKQLTGNYIPDTYQANYVLKGEPFNENVLSKKYPKLIHRFVDGAAE